MRDVVALTGAKICNTVDEQLTHYIVHDRVMSREQQDMLQALRNVKVVHGEWINGCVERGERVDEEPFLLSFSSNQLRNTHKTTAVTSGKKLFGLKSSGSKASLPLKGYIFNSMSISAKVAVRLGATLSMKGPRRSLTK